MPTYSPIKTDGQAAKVAWYYQQKSELADELKASMIGKFDTIILNGVVTDYGIDREGNVYSFLANRPLTWIINVKDGKPQVVIYYQKGGQRVRQRISVDHLVAMQYLTNPNNYKYIGHKDDDPTNCKVENLFWTDYMSVSTRGISLEELTTMFNDVRDLGRCEDEINTTRFLAAIDHMKQLGMKISVETLIANMQPIRYDTHTDDKFQISPFGVIYNIYNKRYYLGKAKQKYLKIRLTDGFHTIHRMVAQTFLANPDKLPAIHHRDGNKLNPAIWNLQWVTNAENSRYGVISGEIPVGENRPTAIHTNEQIHKVCQLLCDTRYSLKAISEMTGVTMATIDAVRNGRQWRNISKGYRIPYCIYDANGNYLYEDKARSKATQKRIQSYEREIID